MATQRKLEQIEAEIAEGKLGIARDRLQGLILAEPRNLALRSRLGDVYWKLGYPVPAGQYWFLDEELDETKQEAIAKFVANCHGDPATVLRRLKLRFDPEEVLQGRAHSIVEAHFRECLSRNLEVPKFEARQSNAMAAANWLGFGCLAAVVVVLAFAVVGILAMVGWVGGR